MYCIVDTDPNVEVKWEYGEHRTLPADIGHKSHANGHLFNPEGEVVDLAGRY